MLMRRNCRGFACTKRQRAEFLTLILKLGQYIHANALSVNNLASRQQRQNPPFPAHCQYSLCTEHCLSLFL